jgi:hypothetical protein
MLEEERPALDVMKVANLSMSLKRYTRQGAAGHVGHQPLQYIRIGSGMEAHRIVFGA